MDANSLNKPLLLSDRVELDQAKKSSFLVSSLKWTLKIVMWMIFIVWVGLIFLYPGEIGSKLIEKIINATNGSIFGITGSLFLVFSAPILIIAFLAAGHLIISGEDVFEKRKTSKSPRYRLWTFPVLVDGIFGVVSAAELIGIILFVLFIVWASYAYTLRNLDFMSELDTHKETSVVMLELTGLRLGMMGLLCLAFLFLPVSRGSLLLRLVDIPFEHATKYHVWLGHLTMMLFTLHGLFFVIGWAMEGNLMKELMEWKRIGIANLPGVISLLAGLFMWVTSLHPVRKNYFELFFYTHQLYVIFVVFLALHVGEFVFSITAGGIFIFMLDRFLRFCQSRRTVRVLSAKCLPCGTVELVLSKPQNLRYNALSFIFLQVRELSWLQWHPFSVSSSPLDGKYHLSVLIKVLGEWTAKLRDTILRASETGPQETKTTITASVEGPYGHESPYHLMYENLILVAGGIGISPFLAILCDILHRVRDGKPCLPRKVLIVWAVKKSDELPLLSTIDMESICPSFSDKVNIETNVYVTRESQPSLEEGKVHVASNSSACPLSGCGMSVLVGTGNNIWSGLYVLVSTIGFIVLMVLLRIFYINPYNITTWWYQALLYILCMVGGVIIFGGFVISLWNLWDKKVSAKDEHEQDDRIKIESDQRNGTVPKKDLNQHIQSSTTIQYGTRPDFREIFGTVSKKWGNVDVGVILCGPPTLQSSVAKEIRSHNITRQRQDAIFHFNSHSFDL